MPHNKHHYRAGIKHISSTQVTQPRRRLPLPYYQHQAAPPGNRRLAPGVSTCEPEPDHRFQQAQRRVIELSMIQAIARSISASFDLHTIFHLAVEHTARSFGYSHVVLYLLEGDELALQATHGFNTYAPPQRLPISRSVSGRVVRTGTSIRVENVAQDPDFVRFNPTTTQFIGVPLKDSSGSILGVLGAAATHTQRLSDDDVLLLELLADHFSIAISNARLVDELRQSEQRYRTLVNNAGDGIAVLNADGTIIDSNAQLSRIAGRPARQLVGHQLADLIDPTDQGIVQRMADDLAAGLSTSAILRIRHPTNGSTLVEIGAGGLGNAGTLAIVRDISERQQLEAQLRQAQKHEAVGTLINGIAHDFNNLLAVITGASELALSTISPQDPLCVDLDQIRAAAERGAQLIRRLLDFSRPDSSQRHTLSTASLIHDVIHLLRPLMPSTIKLELHIDPDLGSIEANLNQIHQVLVNLIVNARDAMPAGGTLRISADNVRFADPVRQQLSHPNRDYVCICVQDTGIGIDEVTLSRVFDPFFTTKEPGRGTGMGLAISRSIVQHHGGLIDLQSSVGHGTRARVLLPATSKMPEALADTTIPLLHGNGELLLVVDDEAGIRENARRMLEQHAYRVLIASNGNQALALLQQHQAVAAVLLDLTMPGIDGRNTFWAMRSINPQLAIVFTSGQSPAMIASELQTPRSAFLAKPYTMSDLTRTIQQVLAAPA